MKRIFMLFIVLLGALFLVSCASDTAVVVKSDRPEESASSVTLTVPVTGTAVLTQPAVLKTEEPRYEVRCKALKIGAVLPASGEIAEYGRKVKNGIELAVKSFNRDNKANITVVYAETEGKEPLKEPVPDVTPEMNTADFYKTVASDRLTVGVIGPVLNTSLPEAIELAETLRVPTVSPSAFGLKKNRNGQYFYSNAVFPEDEGRNIAEFTFNVLKKKRAAVIYQKNNAYGTACAAAFKEELAKLGGEVTREETFDEGSYDFKEQMVNLGGIDPHIIKNIIAADKSNLESIVTKLVNQLRALLPEATEKKRNGVVLLPLVNTGRENEQLPDDFNFGQIISEKLSYGLARYKDTRLPKLAEVKEFTEKNGFDREALAKNFAAGIIISGAVSEKNPLSYSCKVTVENLIENSSTEVVFEFTVSDKLITNPYELEVIYLPVSAYDAESLLSHLVFFELKVPYLGNIRLNDRRFIANVKQNEGEIYFTAEFNPASTIPKVAGFVQAYKDKYFDVPDYYSAAAFDAANVILHAIGRGACSKEDVKNAIRNISAMDLVTGGISCDGAILKKDLHISGIKEKELLELK